MLTRQINRDVVANDGSLADDDAGATVDEEAWSDFLAPARMSMWVRNLKTQETSRPGKRHRCSHSEPASRRQMNRVDVWRGRVDIRAQWARLDRVSETHPRPSTNSSPARRRSRGGLVPQHRGPSFERDPAVACFIARFPTAWDVAPDILQDSGLTGPLRWSA